MRRGEILALKWDDVDLDLGFLSVRRALEQTREGVAFKKPKSRHGRRAISLPPLAIDFLRAHRTKLENLKNLLGRAYQDNGPCVAAMMGASGSLLHSQTRTVAF